MTWIKRAILLSRLLKVYHPSAMGDWTPEDSGMLGSFLKTTATGKRFLNVLRVGQMERLSQTMMAKTGDEAMYLAGAAAGYTAAVATLDELAGANSKAEEAEASESPLNFGIAE